MPSDIRIAIYAPRQGAQGPIRKSLDAKLKAQLEGRLVIRGSWNLCADRLAVASRLTPKPTRRLLNRRQSRSVCFGSPRVPQRSHACSAPRV
jgi:hypothetical protein